MKRIWHNHHTAIILIGSPIIGLLLGLALAWAGEKEDLQKEFDWVLRAKQGPAVALQKGQAADSEQQLLLNGATGAGSGGLRVRSLLYGGALRPGVVLFLAPLLQEIRHLFSDTAPPLHLYPEKPRRNPAEKRPKQTQDLALKSP